MNWTRVLLIGLTALALTFVEVASLSLDPGICIPTNSFTNCPNVLRKDLMEDSMNQRRIPGFLNQKVQVIFIDSIVHFLELVI